MANQYVYMLTEDVDGEYNVIAIFSSHAGAMEGAEVYMKMVERNGMDDDPDFLADGGSFYADIENELRSVWHSDLLDHYVYVDRVTLNLIHA